MADSNQENYARGSEKQEQIIKLLIHIFGVYCEHNDIGVDQAAAVDPVAFLDWYNTNNFLFNRAEVTQELGIDDDCFDYPDGICGTPAGANRLAGVWHRIALSKRPEPEHEVESVTLVAMIKWRDGKLIPISSFVPMVMGKDAPGFDDGIVCSMIASHGHELMNPVVQSGLDGLRQMATDLGTETMQDAFIGMVLMLPEHPQLDPTFKPAFTKLSGVVRGLLSPKLPPVVQRQVDAWRVKRDEYRKAKAAEKVPPKPVSGWDTNSS